MAYLHNYGLNVSRGVKNDIQYGIGFEKNNWHIKKKRSPKKSCTLLKIVVIMCVTLQHTLNHTGQGLGLIPECRICVFLVMVNQQLGSSPIIYTHCSLWFGTEF